MQEVVYRLMPLQVARLRWLALGFLGLTVVLIAASVVTRGPWWIVAVFTGLFGVWFCVSWLGQRGAFTRVGDSGLRARMYFGRTREVPWAEVEDIAIRRTDRNESVHVELFSGSGFTLVAPVHSTLLPDLAFQRKFYDIQRAWESADGAAGGR
jgi:hypothetical protein